MTAIATLPMYDWPEVSGKWDGLWSDLCVALRDWGFDAPDNLTRRAVDFASEDVLLGQTCGLPYVATLHRFVSIVGALDFDLLGCAPGDYNSVLISRDGSLPEAPARAAISDWMSQSGHAALATTAELFGFETIRTGAHRNSIHAVASGEADLAAIDAQSWRLAEAHDPAAGQVRVIRRSQPTPGLPLVTTRHNAVAAIRSAIAPVFEGQAAAALGIKCFVPLTKEDYVRRIPQLRSDNGT